LPGGVWIVSRPAGVDYKVFMMSDWTESLAAIDMDAIKPVFNELAGHEQDAARELAGDRRHLRTAARRTMIDARRVANAVEHVGRLPDPGESIHLVTSGGYSLFHHLPAVLELAAPATIRYLGIATLGFSRENLERLIELLDAGQVGRLDFLYSVYFRSNEKEICERLTHELGRRGHRVLSMRTHCKMLLIETTAGGNYVVESSANLRSCKNIENAVFTNDVALLEFHRRWLNQIFEEAGA
jgi:hypothetical protein